MTRATYFESKFLIEQAVCGRISKRATVASKLLSDVSNVKLQPVLHCLTVSTITTIVVSDRPANFSTIVNKVNRVRQRSNSGALIDFFLIRCK